MSSIEFVQGQEHHTSYWGKAYVKGLEQWRCAEDHDQNRKEKHQTYQYYVCLDVPENTLFTVFFQNGSKRGTDLIEFYICRVCNTRTELNQSYTGCFVERNTELRHSYTGCFIEGNFEVVAQATTKTKAPRFMEWWNASDKTLQTAQRCAKYINKQGQKHYPLNSLPLL